MLLIYFTSFLECHLLRVLKVFTEIYILKCLAYFYLFIYFNCGNMFWQMFQNLFVASGLIYIHIHIILHYIHVILHYIHVIYVYYIYI